MSEKIKKALITGVTGQVGAYLAALLLEIKVMKFTALSIIQHRLG